MTSDITKAMRARQRAQRRTNFQRWSDSHSIRIIVRRPLGFFSAMWFVFVCCMPIGLVLLFGLPPNETDDKPGAA